MKKTVYISGPMRGYPELNFPAFYAAEHRLEIAGWNTLNPARMDKDGVGLPPNGERPVEGSPESLRLYARRDIDALLSLRAENGDAIAMLPGWSVSVGAQAEYRIAKWLGLRVIDAISLNPIREFGEAAA